MNSLGLGLTVKYKDLASTGIGKTGKSLDGLGRSASSMGETSATAFSRFRASAIRLGAAVVAIRGISSALSEARRAASDFGKAIGEVSTLTSESVIPTSQLRDITLGLSDEFGGAPVDQAKALYNAISAGASDAASAAAVMTAANKLAIGGVTDVNSALDGLTSTLNAYGQSFTEAGAASDTFFVAVKAGKTTVGELSRVVGRVAPTANALGVTMDELFASIAAVTTQGLKTSEATTGLKAAFANIIKPTKDAADEAKRLGIDFSAAALRSKGLSKFLGEITSSGKFTEDSLQKLFSSVEGLNAITALTANDSAKLTETLEAMESKAGATSDAFGKMSSTMAFQESQLDATIEKTKILVGEALEPATMSVMKFGREALQAFNAMPQATQAAIVQTAVLAAVVGTLAIATGGAFPVVALLAVTLYALGSIVAELVGDTDTLGGTMEGLTGFIEKVKTQVVAFFDAIRRGVGTEMPAIKNALDGLTGALGEYSGQTQISESMGLSFGKAIGKLVTGLLQVTTAIVHVINWLQPWAMWIARGVDALGGFEAALQAVKVLMIVAASQALAGWITGMAAAASGAVAAAGSTGLLTAAMAAFRAVQAGASIATVAGNVASLGRTLLNSIGPTKAATAAFVGLALAIDQAASAYSEFSEYGDGSFSEGFSRFVDDVKHDVGAISDEDYAKIIAARTGQVTGDAYDQTFEGAAGRRAANAATDVSAAQNVIGSLGGGPVPQGPGQVLVVEKEPSPGPAAAPPQTPPLPGPTGDAPSIDPAAIKAAAEGAAASAAAASPPQIVNATMVVDGQVLGEMSAKFGPRGKSSVPVEIR